MDHLVHLETSLLILPACACGTHACLCGARRQADRCIHKNTGFIAPSLAENVQKEEGHMAHFCDIGEEWPPGTFLQLITLQWVGNIERRKGPTGPFYQLITLQWVGNMERRNGPHGPFPTLTVVHAF